MGKHNTGINHVQTGPKAGGLPGERKEEEVLRPINKLNHKKVIMLGKMGKVKFKKK